MSLLFSGVGGCCCRHYSPRGNEHGMSDNDLIVSEEEVLENNPIVSEEEVLENNPISNEEEMVDNYPIGRATTIGVKSGYWTGSYGGIENGNILLTNAQMYNNLGDVVGAVQNVVRIPIIHCVFAC